MIPKFNINKNKSKFFFYIFAVFLLIIFSAENVNSQELFSVDSEVTYRVGISGITKVEHLITITNIDKQFYSSSYNLLLKNMDPINPEALEGNVKQELVEGSTDSGAVLQVKFDTAVFGENKSRTFLVKYDVENLALKTGEVWEISIPRLDNPNSTNGYTVYLEVPRALGQEAYISPQTSEKSHTIETYKYKFEKDLVTGTGITAGYGEFQFFSFKLNYHLENPLNKPAEVEIAIPPDTTLQKMFYQSINPTPEDLRLDEDGNWLAKYSLKPRQRVDVAVVGDVQIFSTPRKLLPLTQDAYVNNLSSSEFWQTQDPEIKELADELESPENIYNFVSKNLNYDFQRVKPNVRRLGAKKALLNPKSAICMEFTDLFIAIARSAGIPAREANGFAYTENPEIQPLSLVADVLHAWPEYYDQENQLWIPVDPTWGSTTGGVDYFNKLDLRHFTFVYHGKSPLTPYSPGSYKLGPNPQKDVFVNFGHFPSQRQHKIEIFSQVKSKIPLLSRKVGVRLRNTGAVAAYNLSSQIAFDGSVVKTEFSQVLPPYSVLKMEVDIPFSLFARKTPSEIKVTAGASEVIIKLNKERILFQNILLIFIFLLLTSTVILYKLGKIKFLRKIFFKIIIPWKKLISTLPSKSSK